MDRCPVCSDSGEPGGSGGNLNLGGDIGLIKGGLNVTNTTTIGTQNNYQGPVTINQSNTVTAPDAGECLVSGQQALQACQYPAAVDHFQKSLTQNNASVITYYYLALAALQGNRPRLLKLAQIQKIQTQLRAALRLDANSAPVRFLWAIIIEDFYILNKMYFPPNTPQPEELVRPVHSIPAVHAEEMLTHIPAPDNRIWRTLRNSFHAK